jgi:hypothetical protein
MLTGAHGRTRTCTSLVRNQALCPFELRVHWWLSDQDSNLDWPVNNRASCRWTIGEEFGGAPRTRTELNLLAREIRGPCACPDLGLPWGPDPWLRVHGALARTGSDPAKMKEGGAWGRFRAHLSAASARRYHQISFPGEMRLAQVRGLSSNRSRGAQGWRGGCAQAGVVRPTGIEPVSVRGQRTALPLTYGRLGRRQ